MGESASCVRLTGFEVSKRLYVQVDPSIKTPTLTLSKLAAVQPFEKTSPRSSSTIVEIPLTAEIVNGRVVWSTEGGHSEFKPLDQAEPFKVPLIEGNIPMFDDPQPEVSHWFDALIDFKEPVWGVGEPPYLLTLPADTDLELARFGAPVAITGGVANVRLQQMGYVTMSGRAVGDRTTEGTLDAQGVLFLECRGEQRTIRAKHVRDFELRDTSSDPLSVSLKGCSFVRLAAGLGSGNAAIETDVLRSLMLDAPNLDVTIKANRLLLGVMDDYECGLHAGSHRVEIAEIIDLYIQGRTPVSSADHTARLVPSDQGEPTNHFRWMASEGPIFTTPYDLDAFSEHLAAQDQIDIADEEHDPFFDAAQDQLSEVDQDRDPLSEFADVDLSKGVPQAVISGEGIGFGVDPLLPRLDFRDERSGRNSRLSSPSRETLNDPNWTSPNNPDT